MLMLLSFEPTYTGGMYRGPHKTMLNHPVLIIGGYGEEHDDTKYWSVKKILGDEWGDR